MDEDLQILTTRLKKELHEGVVTFTFKKKDGSERIAVGTTKIELVPEEFRPKEKEVKEIKEGEEPVEQKVSVVQTYFDMEKNAWRSLQKEKLVSIVSSVQK